MKSYICNRNVEGMLEVKNIEIHRFHTPQTTRSITLKKKIYYHCRRQSNAQTNTTKYMLTGIYLSYQTIEVVTKWSIYFLNLINEFATNPPIFCN